MALATEYSSSVSEVAIAFSDFDSTVIDPMPEAEKTYEEMEADIEAKYEAEFGSETSPAVEAAQQ